VDPHHFGNPDSAPHQIKIRIRIRIKKQPDPHQSDKLDPDPHHFADDNPKCMEYEPI
jgi:hypothetical protein